MASATYRINGSFDGKPLEKLKTALSQVAEKAKGIGAKIGESFVNLKSAFASAAIEIVKNSKAISQITDKLGNLGSSIKTALGMAISRTIAPITDKINEVLDKSRDKIINIFYNLPEVAQVAFGYIKNIISKTFTADGLANLFKNGFKSMFTIAKARIENIVDYLKTSFENVMLILESLFGRPFVKIENAIAKAGNFFIEVINKALDFIWSNAPDWLKKLFDLLGAGGAAPKIDFQFKTKDENADTGTLKGAIDKGLQNMKDLAARAVQREIEAGKSLADNFKELGSFYKSDNDAFLAKMKEIMGRELPEELRNALETAESAFPTASQSEKADIKGEFSQMIDGLNEELGNKWWQFSAKTQAKLSKINKDLQDGNIELETAMNKVNDTLDHANLDALGSALSDSIAGLGGELGSTVQAIAQGAAQGGPWGAILNVIVKVFEKMASKISEVSPSFDKFTNFIDTIADGALKILDLNLIEDFVQPFVEIFGKIGEVFGTITNVVFQLLNALAPLLDIIAKIISAVAGVIQCVGVILRVLIKVLAPVLKIFEPILLAICKVLDFVLTVFKYVAKGIINVYAFVANAIARCINAVIDILNKLPFVDIDNVGYIDADEMFDDMFKENNFEQENEQNNESEYKSSAANYTAARDIYMNVYYQNSYINGDARAIALSIRDEIRRAEKIGY